MEDAAAGCHFLRAADDGGNPGGAESQNLHWASRIGLALVLGGALSNLFDRMRSGEVEDFLDFYFRTYHWYTFNVADSAIVVGTGLIIVQVLMGG